MPNKVIVVDPVNCSPNSKAVKNPKYYRCIQLTNNKYRTQLKPEFKKYLKEQKEAGMTEAEITNKPCSPKSKYVTDERYQCDPRTGRYHLNTRKYLYVPAEGVPNRPLTPYFRWLAEIRQNLTGEEKAVLKGVAFTQVMGPRWKSLTEEEKKRFITAYETEKAVYDAKIAELKASNYPLRLIAQRAERKVTDFQKYNTKETRVKIAEILKVEIPEWESMKITDKFKAISQRVGIEWKKMHPETQK